MTILLHLFPEFYTEKSITVLDGTARVLYWAAVNERHRHMRRTLTTTHTRTLAHTHVRTHTRTCTLAHTHARTHTHTYTVHDPHQVPDDRPRTLYFQLVLAGTIIDSLH